MYIFIGVFSGVLCLVLFASYIAFRKVFLHTKRNSNVFKGLEGELDGIKKIRREFIERIIKIPYEDVYIEGSDGKRLHARYYHTSDSAPVAIQFHGYKSMSVRDFSGGAYECIELGQNVLLVDQRAHGASEGKSISFGIKEKFDVVSWCEYAIERFGSDSEIILYGISMGAATVLMASELNLPGNVVGIIADCPYSSPKAIIKKVLRDMKLPTWAVYPFIRLGAILWAGFDPNGSSPSEAVKNTDIPILLIHGEEDNFVPCYMSEEIAKNGKTVSLIKFADATHGTSMLYDKEKYMNAIKAFINKQLNKKGRENEN